MTDITIGSPSTDAQWSAYYDLRWKILRKPWNQPAEAIDEEERSSTHLMITTENNQIVAVGRLHRIDQDTGQIRYMAVDSEYHHQGYGSRLLAVLEAVAIEERVSKLILHSRENAVTFYQHYGYRSLKKSYVLFDEIQHYLMAKNLP